MHEIKLEPYCKSKSADELLAALRKAKGKDASCDASGLDILPTGTVQLLLSAKADWSEAGQTFEVTNISALCQEKLLLLGLDSAEFSTGDAA